MKNALKGLTRDWGRFPKDVIADLRDADWPKGTTLEYKNQYRARVALVCALAAVALFGVIPIAALLPAGVAVWKVKIILTDN